MAKSKTEWMICYKLNIGDKSFCKMGKAENGFDLLLVLLVITVIVSIINSRNHSVINNK